MKRIVFLVALLTILLVLTGCQGDTGNDSRAPVETSRIGVMTGSVGEMFVETNYPEAELNRYTSIPDAVVALKSGRLDYVITAYTNALGFVRTNDDLEIIPGVLLDDAAAIAVRKNEVQLLDDVSAVLARFKQDGTLDGIIERWIKEDGSPYEQWEIPVRGADAPVLMVGIAANREPMCFIDNGRPVGLDCELIERIAYELGMRVEYMDMQFSALIPALESGRVSVVISNVTATEERKQVVNFTDDYFQNPQVLFARRTGEVSGDPAYFYAGDWDGKRIGVLSGAVFDKFILEHIPGAQPVYFNNITDGIESLRNGRIDGIMADDAEMRRHVAEVNGLKMLMPFVTHDEYGVITAKGNEELLEQLNDFIALIESDGTYDDMLERWLDTAEPPPIPQIPDGGGDVLRFGTSGVLDGISFYRNGEITGFDVEFAKRFAAHTDRQPEILVMDFGALIPAVQSGRVDFAASMFNITEERRQSVNFTVPYYIGGTVIAVLEGNVESASTSFWEGLKTSFERNLIHENRWMMIVDGLQVSLIITILAFTLATLGGFGVCGLRMSKNPLLRAIGSFYITVLRGTPIVVLLMITFYIIFARSSISGTMVAVIAFGANGAAFIGEIIRSAILTIDKGQVEAARSMGFSKVGAFFTVTFPQAVRVAFPTYMSEFVSLFKMTSVVGYIAIVDLTKAGDIIRSRTYDAFFPLILVALVYLLAASIMIYLFNLINRKTNKRLRRVK